MASDQDVLTYALIGVGGVIVATEAIGAIARLIQEFGKLPGIGPKTAERLTHYLLGADRSEALALADALRAIKESIRPCRQCFNLTEGELCSICSDPRRDASLICVVEQPRDLAALERAGTYRGLYHVLHGRLAPLENIGPGTADRGQPAAARAAGRRAGSHHGHQPDAGRRRDGPVCLESAGRDRGSDHAVGTRFALRIGSGVCQQPDAGRCSGRPADVLKQKEFGLGFPRPVGTQWCDNIGAAKI